MFGRWRIAVSPFTANTPGWTRTSNLRIRSPLLYPLSYGRVGRRWVGASRRDNRILSHK